MGKLLTELRNQASENIHTLSVYEIIKLINDQDKMVANVVEKSLPQIEQAINLMVESIDNGRSVTYYGAGTSGRLGVLDASECPPTFGVSPDLIKGVIAGGDKALRYAIEDIEDNVDLGESDAEEHSNKGDVAIGIASSGHTPYVLGAIRKAKEIGAKTVGISCNINSPLSRLADVAIELPVGAEILTGSTRLKSGTAQKIVLNTLSTTAMIKTGKVYKNLMVNVQATNNKLRKRAISIISEITGADADTAYRVNEAAGGDTKVAILKLMFDIELEKAKSLIEKHNGNFLKAINELTKLN